MAELPCPGSNVALGIYEAFMTALERLDKAANGLTAAGNGVTAWLLPRPTHFTIKAQTVK